MSVQIPEHNFGQFLEQLVQKDHEAWASLDFVLRRVIIHWMLKQYGHSGYFDKSEIEEVYQDAFSKLFEVITGETENTAVFASYDKLKSYAIGIAKNMANQKLRKLKKMEQTTRSLDQEHYIWLISDNDRYAQPGHIEDRDFINTILTDLSYREKMILKRFSEGDKLVDISDELNISPEHCRIIKHRTLKKVSDKLKQLEFTNVSSGNTK